jgi:hypothetical protein
MDNVGSQAQADYAASKENRLREYDVYSTINGIILSISTDFGNQFSS